MAKQRDRMEWWRESRFGMFIHWGLYAIPAGTWKEKRYPGIGEWIMCHAKIPVPEYASLAKHFNPVKFNAREWVKLAKDTGQKYLVITAKHHDGFALYDSPCSEYDIVDATPYGKDVIKSLAKECEKQGIRMCFYYSQFQDWHHPGGGNNHWYDFGDEKKDFETYMREKCIPQVTELLTQYGPIGLIWFDTPCSMSKKDSMRLKCLVHRLQPGCLVSGRIGNGVGDYGSLGDNQHPVGNVKGDWETPCTLNDTWGFKSFDKNWKSVDYLVELLVNCASKGVNYLLNVGPTREGVIPKASVDRLRRVGVWLKANGEAIYGTKASPFPYDFEWGRMTCKKGNLYLLFKRWPRGKFTLLGLRNRVKSVRVLGGKSAKVEMSQLHKKTTDEHVLELVLPGRKPDRIVSVVALDIIGEPDVVSVSLEQKDGSVYLPIHMAELKGPATVTAGEYGFMNGWHTTTASLSWSFKAARPGRFRAYP